MQSKRQTSRGRRPQPGPAATAQPGRTARSGPALRSRAAPSSNEIYDRLLSAILEQKLRPGTKLVEDRLANAFGVSRTKIRQALARLVHDGIIAVSPSRGAEVSSPSPQETREVIEARRIIEPALIGLLAKSATREQVKRLREQVALESKARARGDRATEIWLAGKFHLLIAEMVGNRVMARTLTEVVSLMSLAVILYRSPRAALCPEDEHADLVDLIEAGDAERATREMRTHLDHIEQTLDLAATAPQELPLEAIFAPS
jgi:DNA-binding GntR family transcriptional regulator